MSRLLLLIVFLLATLFGAENQDGQGWVLVKAKTQKDDTWIWTNGGNTESYAVTPEPEVHIGGRIAFLNRRWDTKDSSTGSRVVSTSFHLMGELAGSLVLKRTSTTAEGIGEPDIFYLPLSDNAATFFLDHDGFVRITKSPSTMSYSTQFDYIRR